ncbi:MAG: oligosaccharide flippase family protein [Planctomycetes bacterium]|nr:oligosaccharide flippase family protein [Planctomycetota bacterium]
MRRVPLLAAVAEWFAEDQLRGSSWRGDGLFRRLVQNAGWLLSGTAVATVLGLGGTVLKARALGPGLFGVLAVIVAYVAIVERLATFQPALALIKYGAEALQKDRPDEFMGLVKVSILLDLIGAVSGMALAVLGALVLADRWGWYGSLNAAGGVSGPELQISHMAAVLSTGIAFSLTGTPNGVLRLLDRFRMFTLQMVLTAGLAFVGAAAVYLAGGGLWGFLIVTLVSGIVGNLFLIGASLVALAQRGFLHYWRAPVVSWKPFLHFSGWTYVTSTLDIPVRQLDILIVSVLTSFELTGIYKIIKQVCALLAGLADPLSQAVYPQFAALVADGQERRARTYVLRIGAGIAALVGPAALLLAVSSPWWLGRVFGSAFAAGWLPLSAFLLVTVASISCIALHPLFTALGYVKENATVLLVANGVYLVCAWLLTTALGLAGLALAAGVQLVLVVGLKVMYMHRGRAGHAGALVPGAEVRT